MSDISYKDAGVDIDAGNEFVEAIKADVKSTFDKNVIGGIGSFAGAYALPSGYKEPVILSATDGVGTKLRIAIESGRLDTVGIDLVAMCVNDLICNNGTPMFFLDYYATGKLYSDDDFDLAGFAVGIAERADMDMVANVREGQILIAMPSSGVHSNGYSLVRKLFFDTLGMDLDTDFEGKPLVDTLLEPTRIYVKDYKANKQYVKALAHITGGGIIENLPRVLPEGMRAIVNKDSIRVLPIFEFMGQYVAEDEMYRAFNMGVGMVWVVEPEDVDAVLENTDGYVIGALAKGEKGVEMV